MLGLAAGLQKGGSALLNYVTDNLKLYLDFKKGKHDTLKFPCEGSTEFVASSSQYIDCGNPASLQITGKTITVSAWFKLDGDTDWDKIVANSDGGSYEDGFTLFYQNELLHFSINHYSTNVATTAFTDYGAWHHVVGVYDGTLPSANIKIYLDGVLGTTTDNYTTDIGNNRNTYIGAGYNGSVTDFFDGKIANVGIWERALSLEEINSVMRKNYSQLKSVEKTSLVSWWALDSLEGNAVLDLTTTEVLGNSFITGDNSDMDTVGNWASGSSDFAVSSVSGGNTGNCLKVLNVKGSPATNYGAYLEFSAVTSGKLYKLTFDVQNDGVMTENLKFFLAGTEMKDEIPTTSSWVTQIIYFIADSNATYLTINVDSAIQDGEYYMLDNVFLQEVTSGNHGVPSGATTTTSVYGGNAPVLPRAVDVAREGEAEKIGNGSALFNGSSDYVSIGDTFQSVFQSAFTISAWIKPDDGQPSGVMAFFGSDSTSDQDRFRVMLKTDGKIGVLYKSNNGAGEMDDDSTNAVFSDGATDWTHIAVTITESSGTTTGTVYINGISIAGSFSGSGTMADFATTYNFPIGVANRAGSLTQYFDGSMSQVGIWQGALTQAQIQSVMESTSYATIPASVKSTLGSELSPDVDFSKQSTLAHSSTGTHWITSNANMSISGGKAVKVGGGSAQLQSTSATLLTQDKLYKATVTIDSTDSEDATGTIIFSESGGSGTFPNVVGTHSVYGVSKHGSTRRLYLEMGYHTDATISQFSVKEVTNDLVGYWALDADSLSTSSGSGNSGDDVVHDSTTGETLGDELIGDPSFEDSSYWSFVGGTGTLDVNTTNSGKLTAINAQDKNIYKGSLLEAGKLYKIQITCDSYTDGNWRLHPSHNASENINFVGAIGVTTVYFVAETATLQFIFDNNGDWTWTDISVKEVTSNTGVLK